MVASQGGGADVLGCKAARGGLPDGIATRDLLRPRAVSSQPLDVRPVDASFSTAAVGNGYSVESPIALFRYFGECNLGRWSRRV